MKVRNTLFLISFFTLSLTPGFSQVSLGPRVGVQYSTWATNDAFEYEEIKFISNVMFGAVAEIRINKPIAFQIEADWVRKGARGVNDGNGYSQSDKALIDYVEIPVLFKIGGGNKVRFDFLVGPAFSYASKGSVSSRITVLGATTSNTEDIDFENDEVSRTDLSLQLGGALTFQLGEAAGIFFDARYTQGFIDLYKSTSEDRSALNSGLTLSAGVLFHL